MTIAELYAWSIMSLAGLMILSITILDLAEQTGKATAGGINRLERWGHKFKHFTCWLSGGHETMLDFERGLRLKCINCGWESNGLEE